MARGMSRLLSRAKGRWGCARMNPKSRGPSLPMIEVRAGGIKKFGMSER